MNLTKNDLLPVVESVLSKRDDFFAVARDHGTPCYVYDQKELDAHIDLFVNAFKAHVPNFKPYYALKLNHHPLIIGRVIEKGLGLDVASKRELDMALNAKASHIVYFSPGKSDDDIEYAVANGDTVRIHIDSFPELHRLGAITDKLSQGVEAGIRINLPSQGSWSKYGIQLDALKRFWEEAARYPYIHLNGIHFHQSRNRTPSFYTDTIETIANYLTSSFSPEEREQILYIDFGGGFEVCGSEGVIRRGADGQHTHEIRAASAIETYAQAIGDAINTHLVPIINASYLSEPGRYICNNAMHIMLAIADVKGARDVILNGGVNMVGWQRFEREYFPLINLSMPSLQEMTCNMWGNLCTTWDIWGYSCHADALHEGDIIIVPNQGALTYSLAQNFINEIPPVFSLY